MEDLGDIVPRDDPVRLLSPAKVKSADRKRRLGAEIIEELSVRTSRPHKKRRFVEPIEGGEDLDCDGPLDSMTLHAMVTATRKSPRFQKMYDSIPLSPGDSVKGWMRTASTQPAQVPPRIFGFDCEMVNCGAELNVLARATLVERLPSGKLEVLLDEHVVPPAPVTDYKTPVSGVEEHHLEAATLTLADVQDHLMRVVATQDVLVGHNLSSDLKAVRMIHTRIVDTALLCGVKDLPRWTLGLRDVVQSLFDNHPSVRGFQTEGSAHDSVADAAWSLRAVMALGRRRIDGTAPELLLPTVPARFLTQLQVRGVPRNSQAESVRLLLTKSAGLSLPAACVVSHVECRVETALHEQQLDGGSFQWSTVLVIHTLTRVFTSLLRHALGHDGHTKF